MLLLLNSAKPEDSLQIVPYIVYKATVKGNCEVKFCLARYYPSEKILLSLTD